MVITIGARNDFFGIIAIKQKKSHTFFVADNMLVLAIIRLYQQAAAIIPEVLCDDLIKPSILPWPITAKSLLGHLLSGCGHYKHRSVEYKPRANQWEGKSIHLAEVVRRSTDCESGFAPVPGRASDQGGSKRVRLMNTQEANIDQGNNGIAASNENDFISQRLIRSNY